MLVRIARPRGHFLGRIDVQSEDSTREVYVPLKPPGGVMNPNIRVHPPEPGVVIYRFEASHSSDLQAR
jgi:sodium-independent sulfate anion transporter 11